MMRRTQLVAVIVSLFYTLVLLAPSGSALRTQLRLSLDIAVIAYDPSHTVLNGLGEETYSRHLSCGNWSVDLTARVRYVYAPNWALQSLKAYMESHYVDRGVPSWAKEYIEAHRLTVRWLELRPFYEELWRLSKEVLEERGLRANDIVAIIGNIDNVSRQYYEEPAPYLHVAGLEGVRGWAGEHPLVFYDLSVVPRPWPSKTIPFYGMGRLVNASTEPPLWSLGDPASYIRGLVHDHIRFHYLTLCPTRPWYAPLYRVHIVLVDYGNETLATRIRASINTSLVENLVELMDPWINTSVDLRIVRAEPGTPLYRVVEEAGQENGWLILYYGNTSKLLALDAKKRFPGLNPCGSGSLVQACDFVFYVLATPRPSYMRFQGTSFNFTGFDTGWLGATSYPGYGFRVIRGDINRVIAHEAGHSLGLLHPFQLPRGEIRWLMDFEETPMSYYDEGMAYYRVGDVSPYEAAKTALIHLAGILAAKGTGLSPSVEEWLAKGEPGRALEEAKKLLLGEKQSRCTKSTTTITETVTSTKTCWRTITSVSVTAHSVTKQVTLTEKTTITKTVTRTETSTVTLTETVTRNEQGLVQLLAVLVLGIALGYLAARRRG